MQTNQFSDAIIIKKISENEKQGVFEIDSLYTGYGLTIGNTLRRVLLSSLPGAAITHVKIKGVGHEFSTIPHVLEDVVEIMLNLKKVRFQMHADEPQTMLLKARGERAATAADIKSTATVDVVTPDIHIATLTSKSAELEIELTVERGLGYVPVEARKAEKLPVGVIALDAVFSPVIKTNFTVENMRVGDRTDYNKLTLDIETDGTITPADALRYAAVILHSHFKKLVQSEVIGGGAVAVDKVIESTEEKKTRRKKG